MFLQSYTNTSFYRVIETWLAFSQSERYIVVVLYINKYTTRLDIQPINFKKVLFWNIWLIMTLIRNYILKT
jgi:hypothetical protein